MDERDGGASEAVGRAPIEGLPGIDHKDWCPAQEEEEDDDQQHADDSLLGHQVGRGAAAAAGHPAHRGRVAAGVAQVAQQTLPLGGLHVTAVTVTGLDAAAAGLSVCEDEDRTRTLYILSYKINVFCYYIYR